MSGEARIRELEKVIIKSLEAETGEAPPFTKATAAACCFALAAATFGILMHHMPPQKVGEWWERTAETMRAAWRSGHQQ